MIESQGGKIERESKTNMLLLPYSKKEEWRKEKIKEEVVQRRRRDEGLDEKAVYCHKVREREVNRWEKGWMDGTNPFLR